MGKYCPKIFRGILLPHPVDILQARVSLRHRVSYGCYILDKLLGNVSVPIQLAQCWFPLLAVSNAKI